VSRCDARNVAADRERESVRSSGDRTKIPVLLLDIDGVVNIVGAQMNIPLKWKVVKSATLNQYPFSWAPAVVEKLNHWADTKQAEIRWLTTWDNNARTIVGPALGLREFYLARDPALQLSKLIAATRIAKNEPDRPIVWIDDDMSRIFGNPNDIDIIKYWVARKNTLLVETDPLQGLVDSDLKMVEEFLGKYAVATR
jgi:hypothetical protein